MSARTRTTRLAILTLSGAAALSIAALAAPPAYAQGDRVIGPITSVSGNTFEVAQAAGTAAVAFTDATTISEAVPAQRSDITVGSCIKAGPTAESGSESSGAITAKWVMISTAVDGRCPARPAHAPANPAGPQQHRGVRGVVDAIAGDTVTVTREDAGGATSQATVNITDTTSYKRRVASDAHAIAVGKCVAARGTTDDGGVLQATRVTLWPTTDGNCPQPPR